MRIWRTSTFGLVFASLTACFSAPTPPPKFGDHVVEAYFTLAPAPQPGAAARFSPDLTRLVQARGEEGA